MKWNESVNESHNDKRRKKRDGTQKLLKSIHYALNSRISKRKKYETLTDFQNAGSWFS